MSDSGAIDEAVLATLRADAELAALLPDGIYFDLPDPGSTRYGLVTLVNGLDVAQFGGRLYEDIVYLVKATMFGSHQSQLRQAAARIDELLEDVPLTASGYAWMTTHRILRIRYPEVDQHDPTIRAFHRGGQYRIQMTPVTTPAGGRS